MGREYATGVAFGIIRIDICQKITAVKKVVDMSEIYHFNEMFLVESDIPTFSCVFISCPIILTLFCFF